jgi:RecA-family ATPase
MEQLIPELVKRDPRVVPLAKIFEMESEPQRFLLENFIPSASLTMLCGPSDCGKTILARQIALEIAKGSASVFGSSLNYESQKVIYVSTEDSFKDWRLKTEKYPLTDDEKLSSGKNLHIITEFENDLPQMISDELKKESASLVVFDVFGDTFTGDLNSATAVRSFFKPYKALANKYGTSFLFIHHLSKRGELRERADKQNVLGSMAIESSMRSVLELRRESSESENRVLRITKGNYVSDQIKKIPVYIKLQENFTYLRTESVDCHVIKLQSQVIIKERIYELHDMGHSTRTIAEMLEAEGLATLKKTRISEIIRNRPIEEMGITLSTNLSNDVDEDDEDEIGDNDELNTGINDNDED